MSSFNGGLFNDDLWGSPERLGRGTTAGTSRSSAAGVVRKRAAPMLSVGLSASAASANRRRYSSGRSVGLSASSAPAIRRRLGAGFSVGRSASWAASKRYTGVVLIRSIGTSRTSARAFRFLRGGGVAHGDSRTRIHLFRLVLPTAAGGLRLGTWTRPAHTRPSP